MIKVIYEDTRQKALKHITKNNYWKRNGIQVIRQKLEVGDYMLDPHSNVSIDTKKDILELASDFFSDKTRFEKECIKAKNKCILLIFLIEEQCDKQKLMKWKAPTNVNGKRFLNIYGWQIYKEMQKYTKIYGVKFRFCHKLATGKTIIDILEKETQKK